MCAARHTVLAGSRQFLARHHNALIPAASAVVLAAFLLAALAREFEYAAVLYRSPYQDVSWRAAPGSRADIDTWLIHNGVASHATFASTLPWWYGPWGPGEIDIPGQPGARNTFYRPVSSLAFWLEWKVFRNHEHRYLAVNMACLSLAGVAFVAATFLLLRRFGVRKPWLSVMLCLTGFYTGFGGVVNETVTLTNSLVASLWKNLPDILALLFGLLALIVYLLQRERRKVHPAAWLLWAIPLFLACASKEIALLLPLALMLLETPDKAPAASAVHAPVQTGSFSQKQRRAQTRCRLLALLLFFAVFNGLRIVALHSAGYQYGSNREWLRRYISDNLYPWGTLAFMRSSTGLILGPGFIAALAAGKWLAGPIASTRSPYRYWLAFGAASAVLFAGAYNVLSRRSGAGVDDSLLVSAVGLAQNVVSDFPHALGYLLCPLAIYRLGSRYPGLLLFCGGWILLLSLPNTASAGPLHRNFVPNTGWAWIYGAGFAELIHDAVQPVIMRLESFSASIKQLRIGLKNGSRS